MSIIEEDGEKRVRMAHLAIVGSHSVNGVAALHSEILKHELFRDFHELWPEKFNNKTNGITPRRWLKNANPRLSELITDAIGDRWVRDLPDLKRLAPLAEDPAFVLRWREVKRANKERLVRIIAEQYGRRGTPLAVDPDSMFDGQVKRIHEYKRQLLNVLHVITLYNRMKDDPRGSHVPRTVIFAGKAAPAYRTAKLIIRLVNAVGDVVNRDPDTKDLLKVVFLADYRVSLAERPRDYYEGNPELRRVLDMIGSGAFSPQQPDLFRPLVGSLLDEDRYLLLADYASYVDRQRDVDAAYREPSRWTRMAIRNVAGMGKFSTDRTISEYAREIWGVEPVSPLRTGGSSL